MLFSQEKIKIGVWERYDRTVLPDSNVWTNPKELLNERDDDQNGWIDDRYGIGFDELEHPKIELFEADSAHRALYEHGTAVARLIVDSFHDAVILGAGFEYTSDRLEKSGLLAKSEHERTQNWQNEMKSMDNFVQKSVEWFDRRGVRIINMSWGLNAKKFQWLNQNFGVLAAERKRKAHLWLAHFKDILTQTMKAKPHILFLVAVGNEGKNCDSIEDVPGNIELPNVLNIGSWSLTNGKISNFSNFGEGVDAYLPAENLEITTAPHVREISSGTSLAAPLATALAARWLQCGVPFLEIVARIHRFLPPK